MRRFRILGLSVFAALFPDLSIAFTTPAHKLSERQSTCRSGYTQCDGVPSGFCCDPPSTCLVLASNTTLLCCPDGQDCSIIAPVTCDIQQQNITQHSDATLLTTNLTATLPTCGDQLCCPLGYSCSGSNCMINANQGSSPSHTSSITSTSTPTVVSILTSTSAAPTAPAVTSPSALQTNSTTAQSNCNAFPAPAILAGFFPGLLAGALLACAGFCLFGAYRRKQARLSGSFGKVSASISDPIYQGSAMRSDFIRKQNSAPSSPSRQPTIQRVRSLFRRSAAANGTEMAITSSPVPLRHHQASPPQTPRLQREPSGESINIFADPSTAREGSRGRESQQTTFTDMMRRADLPDVRQGEPFVPRLSPKSYNTSPRGMPRNR